MLSIKCWANYLLLATLPSNVILFAFWGHTFAVWMPFSALQCEEMFAEQPFCLFITGKVFLEHYKIFPRFFNFNLFIQKNGKFWAVCTVFDRKWKNTENGKSTKGNLNLVKRRNGGFKLNTRVLVHFKIIVLWKTNSAPPQHCLSCRITLQLGWTTTKC